MRINKDMFVNAINDIESPIKMQKAAHWKGRAVSAFTPSGVKSFIKTGFRRIKEEINPPSREDREVRALKKEAASLWKGFTQIVCAPALAIVSLKYQYLKENAEMDVTGIRSMEAYSKLNRADKAILGLYINRVSVSRVDQAWDLFK